MKYWSILIINICFLFGCSSSFSESTILSIQYITHDTKSNSILLENLPVCCYKNNRYKYLCMSIDEDPSVKTDLKTFILETQKKFSVFYHGKNIGITEIKNIAAENFQCSQLLIGITETNISDKYLNYNLGPTPYAFSSNIKRPTLPFSVSGKYIEGKRTRYLSINSNSKAIDCQNNSAPLDRDLSKEENAEIKKRLNNIYNKYSDSVIDTSDIIIKEMYIYDFDNDKMCEYIIKSTISDTLKFLTFLYNNENMEPGFILMDNSEGESSISYHIFDVIDLDYDKIPEIVIEFDGYESYGIMIYSMKSGKVNNVYETVLYGC